MTVTSDKCPRCAATAKINGYCADCGRYLGDPGNTPIPSGERIVQLYGRTREPAAPAVPSDAANH